MPILSVLLRLFLVLGLMINGQVAASAGYIAEGGHHHVPAVSPSGDAAASPDDDCHGGNDDPAGAAHSRHAVAAAAMSTAATGAALPDASTPHDCCLASACGDCVASSSAVTSGTGGVAAIRAAEHRPAFDAVSHLSAPLPHLLRPPIV
ncbi:MAG: CopL family metal-binding regulatory protein [Lysobacter sp.]|nr:CopL family metal-binding regulatory protein [Lysobacter sp.]MDQ3269499.1 CopL family metal-binding regulatory protein [Pseudomonadota bacterium]